MATSAAKLVAEIVASPIFYLVAGRQRPRLGSMRPRTAHHRLAVKATLLHEASRAAACRLMRRQHACIAPSRSCTYTHAAPPLQAWWRSSWWRPPGSSR